MKHILIIVLLTIVSCRDKQSHTASSTIIADTTAITDSTIVKFTARYHFNDFTAEVYKGNLGKPDFTNNEFAADKEYVNFITEGCKKEGINFGGKYTILQKSCGAMCEHIFIIDRITGKIFTGILPNDGRYGYLYHSNSRLLVANSGSFTNDSLTEYSNRFGKPEWYEWKNDNFTLLQ